MPAEYMRLIPAPELHVYTIHDNLAKEKCVTMTFKFQNPGSLLSALGKFKIW